MEVVGHKGFTVVHFLLTGCGDLIDKRADIPVREFESQLGLVSQWGRSIKSS